MTRGFPQPGGRHGDDGLKIGREGLQECYDFIDLAVSEDKPFYMWYAAFLPHTPHNPPERLLKKYRDNHPLTIAKYYAMVEWWDETCGDLVGYLEKKGIRENTLIVYVGDNGWIQHPERNGYDARSKQTPYEGGIRQPTLYSWPGTLKPEFRDELVSSIDIFPTTLAAAGARQPTIPVPGLNLLGNLKTGKKIKRKAIFGESFAHDIADIENPEASPLFRWCIEGKWKLLLTKSVPSFSILSKTRTRRTTSPASIPKSSNASLKRSKTGTLSPNETSSPNTSSSALQPEHPSQKNVAGPISGTTAIVLAVPLGRARPPGEPQSLDLTDAAEQALHTTKGPSS